MNKPPTAVSTWKFRKKERFSASLHNGCLKNVEKNKCKISFSLLSLLLTFRPDTHRIRWETFSKSQPSYKYFSRFKHPDHILFAHIY